MQQKEMQDFLTNFQNIFQQTLAKFYASVRSASDTIPVRQQRITLDLTTAAAKGNPYKIGFPFTAIRVETATDNDVNVRLSLNADTDQQIDNYTKLVKNDSMEFSAPQNNGWLTWTAQSGKSITLILYVDVAFRSGTQTSTLSGGVVITAGSGMTPQTKVSVLTTATLLFAASTTRYKNTIQNIGSNDVYISGINTVTIGSGILPGILLQPGDTYEWINSGACYGIADGAASTVSINTEA